jgi:hypothetical protein
MKKEVGTQAAVGIVTQQGAQLLASIAPAVLSLPPAWQVAFLTGSALIQTWGAWGQARVNEIVEELKKDNETFDLKVLGSDEFKTVLLNVIEAHMKEAVAEKRRLYRNYLVNVAKGAPIEVDHHSKLLAVLNLITFDEIDALQNIVAAYDKTEFGSVVPSAHRKLLTAQDICMILGVVDSDGTQVDNMARHIRALQSYNLIFTGDARETATGAPTPGLQEVTEFAREFLRFISEPADEEHE